MDQVIEHDGNSKLTGFVDVSAPILKNHHAGWLRRIVLGWHVSPIIALGAVEDFARPSIFGHRSSRHVFMPLRIWAELVIVLRKGKLCCKRNVNGKANG